MYTDTVLCTKGTETYLQVLPTLSLGAKSNNYDLDVIIMGAVHFFVTKTCCTPSTFLNIKITSALPIVCTKLHQNVK